MTTLLCGGTGRRAGEVGQAGEIALVQQHHEGFLVGEDVLAELGPETCQPLVNGGEALLRRLFQRCAGADKTGVVALQDPRLLGVQVQRLAFCVESREPGIERAIEIEGIVVAGEQR